jgi:hypothetical protein
MKSDCGTRSWRCSWLTHVEYAWRPPPYHNITRSCIGRTVYFYHLWIVISFFIRFQASGRDHAKFIPVKLIFLICMPTTTRSNHMAHIFRPSLSISGGTYIFIGDSKVPIESKRNVLFLTCFKLEGGKSPRATESLVHFVSESLLQQWSQPFPCHLLLEVPRTMWRMLLDCPCVLEYSILHRQEDHCLLSRRIWTAFCTWITVQSLLQISGNKAYPLSVWLVVWLHFSSSSSATTRRSAG